MAEKSQAKTNSLSTIFSNEISSYMSITELFEMKNSGLEIPDRVIRQNARNQLGAEMFTPLTCEQMKLFKWNHPFSTNMKEEYHQNNGQHQSVFEWKLYGDNVVVPEGVVEEDVTMELLLELHLAKMMGRVLKDCDTEWLFGSESSFSAVAFLTTDGNSVEQLKTRCENNYMYSYSKPIDVKRCLSDEDRELIAEIKKCFGNVGQKWEQYLAAHGLKKFESYVDAERSAYEPVESILEILVDRKTYGADTFDAEPQIVIHAGKNPKTGHYLGVLTAIGWTWG